MWMAAVQFRPAKGDWVESASRLDRLIASECPANTGLIVCPEMALTGYVFPSPDAARAVAEVAGAGRTFDLVSRIARRHDAYVVIGYPESDGATLLYNSAMIVSPSGELLYNYRKRLLYEMDETWAAPGNTPYPMIETPFGVLTCGICMDMNDARFIDHLFASGPDVIAFPTNWLDQGFDIRGYWLYCLNGYPGWLIAANTYGVEEGTRFRGTSSILTPEGMLAAGTSREGDAVVLAALPV